MIDRLWDAAPGLRWRAVALGLVALASLALASCAKPEAPPLPPRVDIPHGQGRLWKIEGEDIQLSYVFGTMHVSDPRVLSVPYPVEEAFNKAEIEAFAAVLAPGARKSTRLNSRH